MLFGVEPFEENLNGNVTDRWTEWRRKFEACMADENDESKLKALALFGGADIRKVIDRVVSDEDHPTKLRYQLAMEALEKQFAPKISIAFELQKFMKAAPAPGETIDQFVDRLRQLAKYCELGDQTEKLIVSQIVYTTKDMDLKAKILLNDLPLDMVIAEAREKELFRYVLEQCQTCASHSLAHKRSDRKLSPKWANRRSPWNGRGNHFGLYLHSNLNKHKGDGINSSSGTGFMQMGQIIRKMQLQKLHSMNAEADAVRTCAQRCQFASKLRQFSPNLQKPADSSTK